MKGQSKRNTIGEQLRLLRKKQKMTQFTLCAQLAARGVELRQSSLSKMEAGNRAVRDTEVWEIAHVLSVPVEELFPPEETAVPGAGENLAQNAERA